MVRRLLPNPRFRTRSVLLTDAAREALHDVLDSAPPDLDIFVVDQPVMNAIAGFNIHRGCLALAERPAPLALTDLPLDVVTRVLVLEGVNNPDNVGGIFRSAAAFGVDAVVLGPGCGDPLYRKAVRTSMAATLAVPFADGRRRGRTPCTLSAHTACACWRSRPPRTRARSTTCRTIVHASQFSSARKVRDSRRRRWRPQTTA